MPFCHVLVSNLGPQNEEYLLQPVSGGGEGVTIIPGIRVDADVAEDVQRVIHPFTDRNLVAFEDRTGHRRESLPAVKTAIPLYVVARDRSV